MTSLLTSDQACVSNRCTSGEILRQCLQQQFGSLDSHFGKKNKTEGLCYVGDLAAKTITPKHRLNTATRSDNSLQTLFKGQVHKIQAPTSLLPC